jgi:UDP-N-acetyl-2-amino-2-deoxyglucuronate dehydrogenase
MKIGMIGTGAVANKHAEAYVRIGFELTVCTSQEPEVGRAFAQKYGSIFVENFEAVCRHPDVDIVDVCTLPNFRLEAVALCSETRKHVQVEKPIALNLDIARKMIAVAKNGGILLGVVSQHRFDQSSQFLRKALSEGRLGKLIECDAYVKWHRPAAYYARPGKGAWNVEGGGALMNQAIHQLDLLRFFAGPVQEVYGNWQLGALHSIESEDVLNALVRYRSGATGVIQASTAFWPGYPERLELHGTKGTAIITGDQLSAWDVQNDVGPPPPLMQKTMSGGSDPMAISVESFERQFLDFADAISTGRKPAVDSEEGYAALEFGDAIYRSCREGRRVVLD